MKKFLAITLTIVMLISVVACDSSSDKESNTESTKKTTQTTESKQTTQTTQEETTTEKQTTQTTDNGGGNGNGGGGNNSGSGAGAGPVYGASVSQKDREIHGKYWETIQAIKNAASFHLDVTDLDSTLSYQYDSDEVGNEYVYRSPDYLNSEPLIKGYKVGNAYYDINGAQDTKVATVYSEIQAAITACTTVDQYSKMANFNGSHEEGDDYSISFKNGGKTYICTISDDGTIFELDIMQGTNQMSYSFRAISAQKKPNLLPSGFNR